MHKQFFILLLIASWVLASHAQSDCPPRELPFTDDFEGYWENYTPIYGAQGTDHCWTLCQEVPTGCNSYQILFKHGIGDVWGPGDRDWMDIICGFWWCDINHDGRGDSYTRFQQIVVSPPLAETPWRVTFKAGIRGDHDQKFAYLIVGYVSDTNQIRYSFHALDTITVQRRPDTNDLTYDDGVYWNYDTLILTDTLPTPCHIAFRLDSTLQRRNHRLSDTTNWAFSPAVPYNLFNDHVWIDEVTFHARTHIYTDFYDTVCQGKGYTGYGFDIAPDEVAELHRRDSVEIDTIWHFRLHLNIVKPTTRELFVTLFPGENYHIDTTVLTEAGDYTFSYTDQYGCDSTVIVHIARDTHLDAWFPNVFTPGEETNNLFRGYFNLVPEDYHLYIYNRQGLLVFSTDSYDQGWDGTSQGVAQPQGAYVYLYRFVDSDNRQRSGIGTVTLLR